MSTRKIHKEKAFDEHDLKDLSALLADSDLRCVRCRRDLCCEIVAGTNKCPDCDQPIRLRLHEPRQVTVPWTVTLVTTASLLGSALVMGFRPPLYSNTPEAFAVALGSAIGFAVVYFLLIWEIKALQRWPMWRQWLVTIGLWVVSVPLWWWYDWYRGQWG